MRSVERRFDAAPPRDRAWPLEPTPPEMREMLGGVEQVASFQTELQIDRSDYEVGAGSWAAAVVVGHEVDIEIALEANR